MCLFRKKKKIIQLKFGVPYFDIYDSTYPDFPISVAIRGEISLTINNYKKLLKENDVTFFENKVKTIIISCAKNVIGNIVNEYDICACHIEQQISAIESLIYQKVVEKLKSTFKINDCTITLTDIEIDKTTDSYQKLSAFTQERALKNLKTQISTQHILNKENLQPKKTNAWFFILGGAFLISIGAILLFLLT